MSCQNARLQFSCLKPIHYNFISGQQQHSILYYKTKAIQRKQNFIVQYRKPPILSICQIVFFQTFPLQNFQQRYSLYNTIQMNQEKQEDSSNFLCNNDLENSFDSDDQFQDLSEFSDSGPSISTHSRKNIEMNTLEQSQGKDDKEVKAGKICDQLNRQDSVNSERKLRELLQKLLEKEEKLKQKQELLGGQKERNRFLQKQNNDLKESGKQQDLRIQALEQKLPLLEGEIIRLKKKQLNSSETINEFKKYFERLLGPEVKVLEKQQKLRIPDEYANNFRGIISKIEEIFQQVSEKRAFLQFSKSQFLSDKLAMLDYFQGFIYKQQSKITAQREFIAKLQKDIGSLEKKCQNKGGMASWFDPVVKFCTIEDQKKKTKSKKEFREQK